jgi:hypothetical protein
MPDGSSQVGSKRNARPCMRPYKRRRRGAAASFSTCFQTDGSLFRVRIDVGETNDFPTLTQRIAGLRHACLRAMPPWCT